MPLSLANGFLLASTGLVSLFPWIIEKKTRTRFIQGEYLTDPIQAHGFYRKYKVFIAMNEALTKEVEAFIPMDNRNKNSLYPRRMSYWSYSSSWFLSKIQERDLLL